MTRNKIVTFGEIMLRMTRPDKQRITQGSEWLGLFGGSEANVAVSLAMLGDEVEYVTRLPRNKIGDACRNEIRKYNVGTDFIAYGGDRLGLYYYEESAALRGSSIVYDREDSSLTMMQNDRLEGGFCRRQAVPLVRNLMRPVRRSCQRHTRGNRNGWRNGTCGVVRHKPQGKPVEIWR